MFDLKVTEDKCVVYLLTIPTINVSNMGNMSLVPAYFHRFAKCAKSAQMSILD